MSGTGDNNVTITIKGSVDPSLAASTSAASAQLNTLNASTGQATATAAQYQAAIKALGTDTRNLTLESLGVGAAAKEAAVATEGAAAATVTADTATKGLRLTTSGMIQEYVRMARAIATGRYDLLISESATATSRMGGLSAIFSTAYGPMIAVGAAVVAVAAGIGYLVYRALEARKELDNLTESFALTGRAAQFTQTYIQYELESMSKMPGVTRAAATELLHLLSTHANINSVLTDQLTQLMPAFVKQYGKEAPQAVAKLGEELAGLSLSGFQQLAREQIALNPIQYQTIENLIRTGEIAKAQTLILQAFAKAAGSYMKSEGDEVFDIEQKIASWQLVVVRGTHTMTDAAREHVAALEAELAMIRKREGLSNEADRNRQFETELDTAHSIVQEHDKDGAIQARITQFAKDEAAARAAGNKDAVATFAAAKAAEEVDLKNLRDKAAFKGTGFSNAGQEEIAQARTQVSELGAIEDLSNTERYARAVQIWQQLLNGSKLNAAQRLDVEREMATAQRGLDNAEASARKTAMAAEIADLESVESANIKSADAVAAEKIKSIQDAFRYGQINADEEIAQARAVENARDNAVRQGLQVRLALAYGNVAEIRQINALIEAEERTHQKNLTDIDRKGEEDRVAQWRAANSQILSAESSFISSYLSGQKTLGQAALSALGQFIQQEIEAEARKWTEKKLLALEGVGFDKATEQGGLLSAFIRDREETASAIQSQAAQTSAVVDGQTAQLAAKEAAITAGSQADVAAGSASILNSAYEAAAGAYKAVVGIPYVGPILAPIAAGTAFAAVAAFDTLTALEVGAWEIPSGGPYMLHPGESVVPKDFASGMRAAGFGASPSAAFGGGGAGQSGGGDQYHIHMNTIDGRTGAKFLMDNASTIVSLLATQKRNSSSLFNMSPT